jgi:hypothetical protein
MEKRRTGPHFRTDTDWRPMLGAPLQVRLHARDWRALLVIAAVVLAYGGPDVAELGAGLLGLVMGGLIIVRIVESRPVGPCTTRVLPPPPVM